MQDLTRMPKGGEFTFMRKMLRRSQPKTVAGIEIDGDIVKIVYARERRSDDPEILKLAIRRETAGDSIGEVSESDASERKQPDPRILLIKEIIRTEQIEPNTWYASIPSNLCIIKHIKIPSTDDQELHQMIHHQAVTMLPLDENEIIYDYRVLDETEDGYSHVVLALVQRQAVDEYLKIIMDAGIEPEILTPSVEAIFSSYHPKHSPAYTIATEQQSPPSSRTIEAPGDAEPKNEQRCVAYVDIDYHHSCFLMEEDNKLAYVRSLEVGANALDEDKEFNQKQAQLIVDQVQRTIKTVFQQSSGRQVIDHFYVSGARGISSAVSASIQEVIGTPATLIDSPPRMSEEPTGTTPGSRVNDEASVQSLLGLVSWSITEGINLLPSFIIEARRSRIIKREAIKSVTILALIIAAFALLLSNNYNNKNQYLAYLNQEISKTRSTASELALKQEKVQLHTEHTRKGRSVLQVYSEMYRIIPSSVQLTEMIYDEPDALTLRGEAREMAQVIDLTPVLEKSELFDEVNVKYVTKVQRQENTVNFEISLRVNQ